MRGESRRCKGSIEPLLKLPDGALATRRIVSLLGALRRRRRAAQAYGSKGVQLSSCVGGLAAAQGADFWYRDANE